MMGSIAHKRCSDACAGLDTAVQGVEGEQVAESVVFAPREGGKIRFVKV